MYLGPNASKARIREAENARRNRAEIVKALSQGQIARRDLFKWGLFTGAGLLAAKHGLSHLASSAYAEVPTGAPRSPLFGVRKFTQELRRLEYQEPVSMTKTTVGNEDLASFGGTYGSELPARRASYHELFDKYAYTDKTYVNPLSKVGPAEGRPSGPAYAHQRWGQYFPRKGYVMSWGQVADGFKFHKDFPVSQHPNSVWAFGPGRFTRGTGPFLLKLRYGEPVLMRVYNNTPLKREDNNGFGRNECQFHFHNAHNGAESDGATGAHHFPGTFYDYLWGTCLARADKINKSATDKFASGPDGKGGLIQVPGDWREIQGTLWAHDHRSFFTAENVYKGNLGMVNMYSGRDRGNEKLQDGVNLRLPSGYRKDWGNIDFDVNLIVSDAAWDRNGQLFFDIFTTDGFLGDVPLVNFQFAPKMRVLPRKYRFRILSAGMSRFLKLCVATPDNRVHPVTFIANDGNLVVKPIAQGILDEQSTAERYDIIVDFSKFSPGQKLHLVNVLKQTDGRKPDKALSLGEALRGDSNDPMVGALMQFEIASSVQSIDALPSIVFNKSTDADDSLVPAVLTSQIPIESPVRERVIEFGRGDGDSRRTATGECSPDCADTSTSFPWIVKVNGQAAHSFNSNRVSMVIPKAGDIEHWTYVNGGGGWDHPIHLHFEEGITMSRPGSSIPATEYLVRKDVWRLRPSGKVKFQVQFGEYGGSYVNHCHNTVHEDFAMLMRIQVLSQRLGPDDPHWNVTMTPVPTPEGVKWMKPEILPEGDPSNPKFFTGKV